ncbi:transmembrane protein 42-like [Echeneis naucrates]|uniref:transmembrane protein 42-like n=1 Tax=Echeneis naucrates TaxID=173247 RepID=UPI001113BCB5|nr:transmembrane protein 42-like [Echeneis naucrates]
MACMCSGSFHAILAGVLSALASFSAKLSLGSDYLRDICESSMGGRTKIETHAGHTHCDWLHIPLRLLCGSLLFTCNAVMWTLFSKALQNSPTSARATVTTTASNFISSAILGRLTFGETCTTVWWVGIFLTLCGLLVLHGFTPQALPQGDGKKTK